MTAVPLESAAPVASRARAIAAHIAFSGGIAAEAVVHNKLRASLTSLGILFGVASVIAMLAIGSGAEQEILAQMKMLGANNVIVTPNSQRSFSSRLGTCSHFPCALAPEDFFSSCNTSSLKTLPRCS